MPGRDCPGGRQLGGRTRRVAHTGAELVPGFQPETDPERRLSDDPELLRGWAWGKPRVGHPEGTVGAHAADLLETVEAGAETGVRRAALRLIALVHDALKFRVRRWLPKTGENHHAMRARRVAERYTGDESLLATIELHDRPHSLMAADDPRRKRRPERLRSHAGAHPELRPLYSLRRA
jgi:hypothetical protein